MNDEQADDLFALPTDADRPGHNRPGPPPPGLDAERWQAAIRARRDADPRQRARQVLATLRRKR